MFSKKKIRNAIVLECKLKINSYYEDVLKLAKGEFLSGTNLDDEKKVTIIRKRYLDGVAYAAFDRIHKNQKVADLLMFLLNSPEKCGYDVNIDNGISAGTAFAIAYTALTKKEADEKYCIALNHFQHNLMDSALIKADESLQ